MPGVTIVLFSDLVDSTALLARLGDDRMEQIRRAHVDDVRGIVEDAGGRVVKTLGDGAMASFDSALGALRAAAGIEASAERLDAAHGGIGVAARVGVGAGEPIADNGDLHGMPVVIASRLCAAAAGGEVLVEDLVGGLVASRAGVALEHERSYALKGVPEPVRAASLRWRELTVESPSSDGAAEPRERTAADTRAPPRESSHPMRLPRPLAAYAAEPLIGREREVAALRAATTPRDGCRAVLLLGEPGIGKTRHAAGAAADAHAGGAVVALARCSPDPTIAFEPWVRAIGELALAGDDAWRGQLADAAGRELAALVPELSGRRAAGTANGGGLVAAEGARYRFLCGIGAALGCAAGAAPLLVVLEDAHWCDAASAQALGHLLERPPTTRFTLVVTARERELGRGHPIARVLADLRYTHDLTELRLTGLDPEALAALVAATVGRAITPELAARLRARTAGNPFFAAELARDLDARGALCAGEALDAAPAPDAIAGLVEERLARLDPMTERLLVGAAAIGASAPVALAARAAGVDPGDVERALAEALSERLVDALPAPRPTIGFPHALIREALAARPDEAACARLHLAIAQALEDDPAAEPAELARHHRLAVAVAGPGRAIAACKAAAVAAAAAHDHEQAAAQLRCALALIPPDDDAARTPLLVELGEQELLGADLRRAREAFRAAGEAARAIGDAVALARAALGFAAGDVGFGMEIGAVDAAIVPPLREALDALGEREPRLALRIVFRLTSALVYTDDDAVLHALVQRAEELDARLGDAESRVLAGFTALVGACGRSSPPLSVLERVKPFFELSDAAEACGRDELQFRFMQASAVVRYMLGDVEACERAVERAAEVAERLGSPRFAWEVDMYRSHRRLERGDRAGGEALARRAGATVRRLRPDMHLFVELWPRLLTGWLYDDETQVAPAVYRDIEKAVPYGIVSAAVACAAAMNGDRETAHRVLARCLASDDLAALRQPDIQLPAGLCYLALAATQIGDRDAGERLRPLLEPLRPYLPQVSPVIWFGQLPEWHIGRLELLADRPAAAVRELRAAVARADALELAWLTGWARVDLALALHRRHAAGDRAEAQALLAQAQALAERYGMRWVERRVAVARARIAGREPPAAAPAPARVRPVRALATQRGRRALAATVRDQDDAALERRFAEPRRQRALLRVLARSFQPALAGGFRGLVAFELEPFAIDPPPEAPWRWAIEIDAPAGRARLREPAPLDAQATLHFGLADWVRVVAGLESPVTVMTAGRCSVAGDVVLAARLEAIFGGSEGARTQ
jgi:class 3 adenylate cyclase/tetratricopeptide (TPR) repeat protein